MPSMKSANPLSINSPSALKAYFLAARPKTWIASISPVLIGVSMASKIDLSIFLLTLCFSLLIQVGTNFANDYFDFVKGADTHLRNGPKRATLEGWISPKAMKWAFVICFASAFLIALPLMFQAGTWSFFVAGLCIAFGILYTGGPKPLGYIGAGELFVFVFFGPVATCGTFFLQTATVTLPVLIASLAPGLLSCSILLANNIRDEISDRLANKNTLVVRFGKLFGCISYVSTILLTAFVAPTLILFFGANISLLASSLILLTAIPSIRRVFSFKDPLEMIQVLQSSALLLAIYTILFCFSTW